MPCPYINFIPDDKSPGHQLKKTIKEVDSIVGTGCVLRMVLHGKGGEFSMAHTFKAAVIEIDMGHLN